MSFIMPKIDLSNPSFSEDMDNMVPDALLVYGYLSSISNQHGFLIERPNALEPDIIKYFHYILLRVLYKNKSWKTPYPQAWYMPNIIEKEWYKIYDDKFYSLVDYIMQSNLFIGKIYEPFIEGRTSH